MRINISDIKIDQCTMQEAVQATAGLIEGKKNGYIVTPNIDHIVMLRKDAEFRRIYEEASLVLADGMPILWAARFLRTPLREKISGSDLFPKLCKMAEEKGYRVFFLGGRSGAAEKASKALTKRYPKLQIVGTYCPPFGFENDIDENRKIVSMIIESHPDILFVGLGAPKQEKWIYKHKDQYHVPVSVGIGASFEFLSEMVKRAPKWMQDAGLEWFWRLMMEPKRLWKRYLVNDPVFFWLVIKQKIGMK